MPFMSLLFVLRPFVLSCKKTPWLIFKWIKGDLDHLIITHMKPNVCEIVKKRRSLLLKTERYAGRLAKAYCKYAVNLNLKKVTILNLTTFPQNTF